MPSLITLCYTPTYASNRYRLKLFTSCGFCRRLAVADFVINVLRPGLFGGQKPGSSTDLLRYCTFGLEAANDAQNVRVDTARGKDNHQQTLLKMIMLYCRSLQMSEDTIMLFVSSRRTTNKLQLELINVLIRSIFEH